MLKAGPPRSTGLLYPGQSSTAGTSDQSASTDLSIACRRIERLLSVHLNNIVLGKIETPFLERAHSDFARVGGKRGNAVNDLATFGVEEPG